MHLMTKLIQLYMNEKGTERLLKYDSLADEFNQILQNTGPASEDTPKVVRTMQEIDQERVKYFVKEYIMCRFDKIRKNFYLDPSLMSQKEQVFYAKFLDLMRRTDLYFDTIAGDGHEFVGFIANTNLKSVRIDTEVVDILEGDFFIANYDDISEHLVNGSVSLA